MRVLIHVLGWAEAGIDTQGEPAAAPERVAQWRRDAELASAGPGSAVGNRALFVPIDGHPRTPLARFLHLVAPRADDVVLLLGTHTIGDSADAWSDTIAVATQAALCLAERPHMLGVEQPVPARAVAVPVAPGERFTLDRTREALLEVLDDLVAAGESFDEIHVSTGAGSKVLLAGVIVAAYERTRRVVLSDVSDQPAAAPGDPFRIMTERRDPVPWLRRRRLFGALADIAEVAGDADRAALLRLMHARQRWQVGLAGQLFVAGLGKGWWSTADLEAVKPDIHQNLTDLLAQRSLRAPLVARRWLMETAVALGLDAPGGVNGRVGSVLSGLPAAGSRRTVAQNWVYDHRIVAEAAVTAPGPDGLQRHALKPLALGRLMKTVAAVRTWNDRVATWRAIANVPAGTPGERRDEISGLFAAEWRWSATDPLPGPLVLIVAPAGTQEESVDGGFPFARAFVEPGTLRTWTLFGLPPAHANDPVPQAELHIVRIATAQTRLATDRSNYWLQSRGASVSIIESGAGDVDPGTMRESLEQSLPDGRSPDVVVCVVGPGTHRMAWAALAASLGLAHDHGSAAVIATASMAPGGAGTVIDTADDYVAGLPQWDSALARLAVSQLHDREPAAAAHTLSVASRRLSPLEAEADRLTEELAAPRPRDGIEPAQSRLWAAQRILALLPLAETDPWFSVVMAHAATELSIGACPPAGGGLHGLWDTPELTELRRVRNSAPFTHGDASSDLPIAAAQDILTAAASVLAPDGATREDLGLLRDAFDTLVRRLSEFT